MCGQLLLGPKRWDGPGYSLTQAARAGCSTWACFFMYQEIVQTVSWFPHPVAYAMLAFQVLSSSLLIAPGLLMSLQPEDLPGFLWAPVYRLQRRLCRRCSCYGHPLVQVFLSLLIVSLRIGLTGIPWLNGQRDRPAALRSAYIFVALSSDALALAACAARRCLGAPALGPETAEKGN